MPIFEATASNLAAIPATSFAALGLKERTDLQRLLAARIEALEEGLMVLAEEFGDWTDSARRIDLLCLAPVVVLCVIRFLHLLDTPLTINLRMCMCTNAFQT